MIKPPQAREERAEGAQPASALFELRVRIPRSWLRELDEAAGAHFINRSDLVRLMLRDFLRHRHETPVAAWPGSSVSSSATATTTDADSA